MNDSQQIFYFVGVAPAVGLLIGVERDWKARGAEEGERVAGVRTYGLIGLLGGGAAVLAQHTGPLLAGLMFLGPAAALTAVYVVTQNSQDTDVGITSLVASLVTFVLGALAGVGEVAFAGAAIAALRHGSVQTAVLTPCAAAGRNRHISRSCFSRFIIFLILPFSARETSWSVHRTKPGKPGHTLVSLDITVPSWRLLIENRPLPWRNGLMRRL
jgi:hypothetical protein